MNKVTKKLKLSIDSLKPCDQIYYKTTFPVRITHSVCHLRKNVEIFTFSSPYLIRRKLWSTVPELGLGSYIGWWDTSSNPAKIICCFLNQETLSMLLSSGL